MKLINTVAQPMPLTNGQIYEENLYISFIQNKIKYTCFHSVNTPARLY